MGVPRMSQAESISHATFSALMWSLSYPGRAHLLPHGGLTAFATLADTLLDIETSYHTDYPAFAPTLARTGARSLPPAAAMYHFYPALAEPALGPLADAPAGSYAYPDASATLVLGCRFGAGRRLSLTGPGITRTQTLWVEQVPDGFWALRERACRYPLGWDVFLVADRQVVGLPRTTLVEVH
jgi:alpha-D-ribose 1-methylphosphonate 5-triphosphate synthase subunit PhnH